MKLLVLLFATLPILLAASYPIPLPGTSGNAMVSNGTKWVSGSVGSATNATNIGITNDTTTNATMYPTWVTTTTGNLPAKVSSTKLSFNPSTGTLTSTAFFGSLTGTASGNTTYTANQYGVVVSGAGNTMSVIAPDASTTKYLKSGGASANPTWDTVTAAAQYNYTAKTTTYAAVIGDFVDCTSGTFTVTLPTAVGVSGQSIKIKNSGTGVITIATTSSQTIDGVASTVITLGSIRDYIDVVSDGANWILTASKLSVWIRRSTGAGHGSTNTKIRRIETTVGTDVGSSIVTYASSAANGTSFTINVTGTYSIVYSDRHDAGATAHGISLNSTQLTTNASSITAADRLSYATPSAAGFNGLAVAVAALKAGDVIRPHDQGTTDGTSAADVYITITRVD